MPGYNRSAWIYFTPIGFSARIDVLLAQDEGLLLAQEESHLLVQEEGFLMEAFTRIELLPGYITMPRYTQFHYIPDTYPFLPGYPDRPTRV